MTTQAPATKLDQVRTPAREVAAAWRTPRSRIERPVNVDLQNLDCVQYLRTLLRRSGYPNWSELIDIHGHEYNDFLNDDSYDHHVNHIDHIDHIDHDHYSGHHRPWDTRRCARCPR